MIFDSHLLTYWIIWIGQKKNIQDVSKFVNHHFERVIRDSCDQIKQRINYKPLRQNTIDETTPLNNVL